MRIRLITKDDVNWNKAVELAQSKYRTVFGAEISPTPDYFVVYISGSERKHGAEIVAAAGLTCSSGRHLFSEQYLDGPIESILSRFEEKEISRDMIVEVGSLASIEKNAGRELVNFVPILSWCLGKHYILCTTTQPLRHLFEAVNLDFHPLREADPARLGTGAIEKWGDYYNLAPITGYIRLNNIQSLFSCNTGRYRFSHFDVNLPEAIQEYSYAAS